MTIIKLFEEFSEVKKWKLYSGLSGGFGGAQFKRKFTGTRERADMEAYQDAVEDYESYEGLHGLRTVSEIMEDDGVDEDEAQEIYNEEREGWLDYYAKEDDGKIEESVVQTDKLQSQLDGFNFKEDKVKSSFIPRKNVIRWADSLKSKYPLLDIKIQKNGDTLVAIAFKKPIMTFESVDNDIKIQFVNKKNQTQAFNIYKTPDGRITKIEKPAHVHVRFPFVVGQVLNRSVETWACNNNFYIDGKDTCPEEKLFGIKKSDIPKGHELRSLFPQKFR